MTSMVFIGNPGARKRALLNALGETFNSGFSPIEGLTKEVSKQMVTVHNRSIRLVDLPGINDIANDNDGVIDGNLRKLQQTLNDGNEYVTFFEVSPRNGRIMVSDFNIMKLVLDKMHKGPSVGLILTQVEGQNYEQVSSPGYFGSIEEMLKDSGAKMKFLERVKKPLVLQNHNEWFNDQELSNIQKYVLSFELGKVVLSSLIIHAWRTIIEFFKRLFQSRKSESK